jgi:hypothetical protein
VEVCRVPRFKHWLDWLGGDVRSTTTQSEREVWCRRSGKERRDLQDDVVDNGREGRGILRTWKRHWHQDAISGKWRATHWAPLGSCSDWRTHEMTGETCLSLLGNEQYKSMDVVCCGSPFCFTCPTITFRYCDIKLKSGVAAPLCTKDRRA